MLRIGLVCVLEVFHLSSRGESLSNDVAAQVEQGLREREHRLLRSACSLVEIQHTTTVCRLHVVVV